LISIGSAENFPPEQSRSFSCGFNGVTIEGFVVRQGTAFFAYLNRCPHTGAPLNWNPDQFLTLTGELIQCSLHGALFEIADGKCIAGPCMGGSLTAIPLRVEAGEILIDLEVVSPLGQGQA